MTFVKRFIVCFCISFTLFIFLYFTYVLKVTIASRNIKALQRQSINLARTMKPFPLSLYPQNLFCPRFALWTLLIENVFTLWRIGKLQRDPIDIYFKSWGLLVKDIFYDKRNSVPNMIWLVVDNADVTINLFFFTTFSETQEMLSLVPAFMKPIDNRNPHLKIHQTICSLYNNLDHPLPLSVPGMSYVIGASAGCGLSVPFLYHFTSPVYVLHFGSLKLINSALRLHLKDRICFNVVNTSDIFTMFPNPNGTQPWCSLGEYIYFSSTSEGAWDAHMMTTYMEYLASRVITPRQWI